MSLGLSPTFGFCSKMSRITEFKPSKSSQIDLTWLLRNLHINYLFWNKRFLGFAFSFSFIYIFIHSLIFTCLSLLFPALFLWVLADLCMLM